MPYPAQGLYPSSLLYPLEAGVEFVNFTKDFKRLVDRYGRSLKNARTDSSFRAILNILSGTKGIGDNRTMKCGDAIAYVLPSLSYKLGDHIMPVSGRGEWVIVTERYASRIGDLRVFRVLALERYTPGTTLKGEYTIAEPAIAGVNFTGVYALTEELVYLEMLSRYDINAFTGLYPSTTLYPSTSLYPRGPGRAVDIVGAGFVSLYTVTEKLVYLEMLSRYDINALEVPGIALAGIYNLTSKEVRKEMVSSYDITKTPAQITGERSFVAAQNIDNYWNPWDDEDLSYYKVHRSLNNLFAPSDANLVGVPSTNSFKHTNLVAVTQYYFKVCAVTKLGVSGTYSAQFAATTA